MNILSRCDSICIQFTLHSTLFSTHRQQITPDNIPIRITLNKLPPSWPQEPEHLNTWRDVYITNADTHILLHSNGHYRDILEKRMRICKLYVFRLICKELDSSHFSVWDFLEHFLNCFYILQIYSMPIVKILQVEGWNNCEVYLHVFFTDFIVPLSH